MRRVGSPTRQNPILNIFKDMFHYGLEVFGRYYANYRGLVYDVNDPEHLGRIKLIIPEVGADTPYEYWAHPKGVFSGKGYGSQVLPQKGDLVWVSFEGGHPEVPIWEHGYFGTDEPPTDEDLDDVNCYWFKTPKGHLIKVNDTKSYIHIQHKGGQTILIDDDYISLISDKKISLGTKDGSEESAMLGDSTKDLLQSMVDYMDTLSQALLSDAGTLTTYAPQTIVKNASSLLPGVIEMKEQIQKILSKKNTLD